MAYVNHLLTFIESNPALAVGFNLILLLLSGIFAHLLGNDSNLLIVFYVQIMPDDFVMQLHR
ncbi:hypothetical protein V6145_16765, partial [Klebsiella pneumoniae]